MAIYYYCSRVMPDTKSWSDLGTILNLDLEGKRKKITYISGCMNDRLAPKKIKEESKSYRNGATKNLMKLGVEFDEFNLFWKDADYVAMVEQILQSDVIYLLGGNPVEQMKYIEANGLSSVLKAYSGIIIGVSSGSMAMSSKLIVPACGDAYPETKVYSGLDLMDINVFPHFEVNKHTNSIAVKDGDISIGEILKISEQYEMIGLPNGSILRCSSDGIYALGETPQIINGGEVKDATLEEDKLDNIPVKRLVYKK